MAINDKAYSPKQFSFLIAMQDDWGTINPDSKPVDVRPANTTSFSTFKVNEFTNTLECPAIILSSASQELI